MDPYEPEGKIPVIHTEYVPVPVPTYQVNVAAELHGKLAAIFPNQNANDNMLDLNCKHCNSDWWTGRFFALSELQLVEPMAIECETCGTIGHISLSRRNELASSMCYSRHRLNQTLLKLIYDNLYPESVTITGDWFGRTDCGQILPVVWTDGGTAGHVNVANRDHDYATFTGFTYF